MNNSIYDETYAAISELYTIAKLKAGNIAIDTLSKEQEKYLNA